MSHFSEELNIVEVQRHRCCSFFIETEELFHYFDQSRVLQSRQLFCCSCTERHRVVDAAVLAGSLLKQRFYYQWVFAWLNKGRPLKSCSTYPRMCVFLFVYNLLTQQIHELWHFLYLYMKLLSHLVSFALLLLFFFLHCFLNSWSTQIQLMCLKTPLSRSL